MFLNGILHIDIALKRSVLITDILLVCVSLLKAPDTIHRKSLPFPFKITSLAFSIFFSHFSIRFRFLTWEGQYPPFFIVPLALT